MRKLALISVLLSGLAAAQPSPQLLEQHRSKPNDWKLCYDIALAYTQAQQLSEAAAFYKKTLQLRPDFLPAKKNLATVTWFLGRRSESEAMFRSLLTAIPNDPVPNLYIGVAEAERRRFTSAKGHFSKAGDLALRNPEVLPTVVEAFLAAKDTSNVPVALKTISETEAAQPQLRNIIAAVFNRYHAWNGTVQALERVPPSDLAASLLLAEAYDRLNLPEQAYSTYAKALAANPSEESAYLSLAVFASGHRNSRYGLEVLEKGMKQLPSSWRMPLHAGLLLALEGDHAGAERQLRLAMNNSAGSELPLLALGVLELETGRVVEAISTFERAATLNPRDANARYFHALALYRSGEVRHRTAALAAVRTALEIAPNDTKSRVLLGQIQIAAGNIEEGAGELVKALRKEPQNGTALYQLSLARRKQGRAAEADRHMAAFRKLKTDAREAESQIVQIMKIAR